MTRWFSKLSMPAAAAAAALTLLAGPAAAATIRWDLQNVVFSGGGTATGYFVLDTDLKTLIDWSITTSAWTYPDPDPANAPITSGPFTYGAGVAGQMGIADSSSDPVLGVFFSDPSALYGNGSADSYRQLQLYGLASLETPGDVALNTNSSAECFRCNPYRLVSEGSLVGTSLVPEPSTYALMIAGLLGLGYVARRRKSA